MIFLYTVKRSTLTPHASGIKILATSLAGVHALLSEHEIQGMSDVIKNIIILNNLTFHFYLFYLDLY